MSPTRIARAERAFVARVLTTAVAVGATLGVGATLLVAVVWDPWGIQEHRAVERASDATAIAICISRDAFEQRLAGVRGDATVNGRANLIDVLNDGLVRYDDALRLLRRSCDQTTGGD